MLGQDDIYSADDGFTSKLIQSNLGIHFSSEEEAEGELPAVMDALDQTIRVHEAVAVTRRAGTKKKQTNEFSTERLIRETGAPLPVVVSKPKTFASLAARSDKLDDCRSKLALLKRRLTPEQFELLKKSPRLTTDESINAADNLVVVNAGNARRLGKGEGSAGMPVPRTKPTSIELLNRHLDARITTQGGVYERLRQIKASKKRGKCAVAPKVQPQVENKFVAPFGYDRARSLQRQFEAQSKAAEEEAVDEAELNPLLYPDEEPLTAHRDIHPDPDEEAGDSCSEEQVRSKHVSFRDSVETHSPKADSPREKDLACLFVDDEAESGDSDEEGGNKQHRTAEYYDEEQYRKDVEDFLTDDESIGEGNLQDIHRRIAMEDDKRAINALVSKFGVVDDEAVAWMKRMHDTHNVHDGTQESIPAGTKALSAEHASKIEYLSKLGFARTRTLQPATDEFMFAEEARADTSHPPTSEPNDSDLGSFDLEPSGSSSAEEMDAQIPSESEMTVEEPGIALLGGAPEVQDLGVVELCNRKDVFGMLGRKQKARPQHMQPPNLIVSTKKVVQ